MGRVALTAVAFSIAATGACKEGAKREERATDGLVRVDQIAKVLPSIRRLSLDRPIPAARQTTTDFLGFVRTSIAGDTHLDHHAIALQALGLIEPATNVAKSLESAYSTQIAAYYDPRKRAFALVMEPADPTIFDVLISHELTHGLQDQHFDLTTYLGGTQDHPLNADEQIARRFVTEGDAQFTSMVHLVYTKTDQKELTGEQVRVAKRELAKLSDLDVKAMAASVKQQLGSANVDAGAFQTALDAMPGIPPAILEPILAPYMRGATMIAEVYERGGWTAVDKLYKDPPLSTKQVLHPREELIGGPHAPRVLTLPPITAKDSVLLESDVLGELMWSVYFRRWKHAGEARPEVGWEGDRYAVWRDAHGVTTVIATAWTTSYHAKDFYDAYLSTLDARFPDRKPGTGEQVRERLWVRLVEDRVLIVDGSATSLLDAVEQTP